MDHSEDITVLTLCASHISLYQRMNKRWHRRLRLLARAPGKQPFMLIKKTWQIRRLYKKSSNIITAYKEWNKFITSHKASTHLMLDTTYPEISDAIIYNTNEKLRIVTPQTKPTN
ncbi:hypothetical protein GCM10007941_33500 [Amphritea balenae]|nr:hypothetical protein GCM10007941_33500 [Amphritea balenae]